MKLRIVSFVALTAMIPMAFGVDSATARRRAPISTRWSITNGASVSRAAVSDTTVFYTSGPVATAVDLQTGAVKWAHDFTDPQYGAPFLGAPALNGTSVVLPIAVPGAGGTATLDATTGALIGTIGIAFHQFTGPITFDGTLGIRGVGAYGSGTPLLATANFGGRNYFLSFDQNSNIPDFAISAGRAFGISNNTVLALDNNQPCIPLPPPFPLSNYCAPTWSAPVNGARKPSNAGSGRVAVASTTGTVTVLDAATGALKFTTANAGTSLSPTAYFNGHVFTNGTDGVLRSYNVNTCTNGCTPEWTANLGAAATQAPTVGAVNGSFGVIAATSNGTVVGFSANGCGAPSCNANFNAVAPHGGAATSKPVIKNGVVLATFGNDLVAF